MKIQDGNYLQDSLFLQKHTKQL